MFNCKILSFMRNIPLKESHYASAINKEIALINVEIVKISAFLATTTDCRLTVLFVSDMKERKKFLQELLNDYHNFDYYVELFALLGYGKTKMFELAKINRDTFYKRLSRMETITAHLSQIKGTYQQFRNAENAK